jgi:hypothetical protein
MKNYQVTSKTWGYIGTYRANSEKHALDKMVRKAGYRDFAASCQSCCVSLAEGRAEYTIVATDDEQ